MTLKIIKEAKEKFGDLTDWISGIGGAIMFVGFLMILLILFYKFIDVIVWLMEGYWLNHKFYNFCDWIGLTYWDTAFMTGWVGLDSLIYEYIILQTFAKGTGNLALVFMGVGGLIAWITESTRN